MRHALPLLIALGLLTGCPEDPVPATDAGTNQDAGAQDSGAGGVDAAQDAGVIEDTGVVTADTGPGEDATPDAEADMGTPLEVTAANYCELTADMFCGYYLRCGRIVADGLDECRATFMETCNGVYEPVYAAYADEGALELSEDGIQTCATHLETVACEEQIFDLDGGCAGMWRGLVNEGGACAPGIGSFVCTEGTSCVLGLDFCGTCQSGAAAGEACVPGEVRCDGESQCIDGTCVARPVAGQACQEDGARCAPGSSCQGGVCRGPDIVGVGDSCDQARRCPYRSDRIDGTCVRAGLLGEACTDNGCASGFCDGSICQPVREAFKGCSAGRECQSGRCTGGFCAPAVSECLTAE